VAAGVVLPNPPETNQSSAGHHHDIDDDRSNRANDDKTHNVFHNPLFHCHAPVHYAV
jgi:hypothetical protein